MQDIAGISILADSEEVKVLLFSRDSFRRRVFAARDLNHRISRRSAADCFPNERDSDFATSCLTA